MTDQHERVELTRLDQFPIPSDDLSGWQSTRTPTRTGTTTASSSARRHTASRPGARATPTRSGCSAEEYEIEPSGPLQIELLKLQGWVKDTGQKVVVVFEGRDAAGKGGTIKRFTEHLNPRAPAWSRWRSRPSASAASGTSSATSRTCRPAGEIVLFDRSWYNRAGVERVMGFCTDDEYLEFMRQAPEFERMLVDSGIHLVKLWFSVSPGRAAHPVHRSGRSTRSGSGSSSPTDLASLDKWDDYTEAKEAMFLYTDTAHAPWTVVKSNDKKRARLEAMRHVLDPLRLRRQGRGAGRHSRPADRRLGRQRARGRRADRPPLPEAVTGR